MGQVWGYGKREQSQTLGMEGGIRRTYGPEQWQSGGKRRKSGVQRLETGREAACVGATHASPLRLAVIG